MVTSTKSENTGSSSRVEDNVQPATLGTPLQLPFSKRWVPNRLMKASLTERIASYDANDLEARGIPTDDLARLYETWAISGCGINITGNILIDYTNLERAGNMIVPPDAEPHGPRFEAFAKLAQVTNSHGGLLLGQVNHPGRQVNRVYQPNPISASDVPLGDNMVYITANPPRPATKSEIEDIISSFAHTASYLERAGFAGIQIHAAHGYLISQFLSLSTNKRDDEYGPASIESRARLLTQTCQRVRAQTKPDFILSVKLNSVEFETGGLQPEEAGALCRLLDDAGVDLIELSGGTYKRFLWDYGSGPRRESTLRREGFFMEFADTIVAMNKGCKSKIYVTGGFRSRSAMLDALKTVDGIGLGRPMTQELDLPGNLIEGRVKGAVDVAYDPDSFNLGAMISMAQMREIAEGRRAMDASDKKEVEEFVQLAFKGGDQDAGKVDYKPFCLPAREVCVE